MQSAPETADEKERLKDLYQYNVLDTEAEKVFDDLTRLASEICETPIALISLVDPDRQWFKSKVGIDVEETSRDIAFCAHAIHRQEVFEVTDTLNDERFFDNPLVTGGPNIRFYAGTPLVTPRGRAIGTLCTISDEPKTLSAHQKQALEILGRSVISQLELRLTNAQLKLANERKTDFLSNISHELRTPLNAIVSLSKLMLEDVNRQTLPDKFQEYVSHIDYSGKRLLDLVNSVLDLSKVEAGKMELTPSVIKSRQFFSAMRGMMNARANEYMVHFEMTIAPDVPVALLFDETKLSQIILNVLSNAIKFTPPKKRVSFTVSAPDDQLVLMVEDQGVGIAEHDLPTLFDKFKQVGAHRSREGTGLGLPITKALAELMGGQITVESTLGEGTQVCIFLPLESVLMSNYQHKQAVVDINSNAKILVVEDNMINQEVARAIFESLALQIDLADTGEEAVEKAKAAEYDLVFMDLHLPGIDGWEAARRIHLNNSDTPIVALSADAFSNDAGQYQNKGILDFLTKPIDRDHLLRVLGKFIPSG